MIRRVCRGIDEREAERRGVDGDRASCLERKARATVHGSFLDSHEHFARDFGVLIGVCGTSEDLVYCASTDGGYGINTAICAGDGSIVVDEDAISDKDSHTVDVFNSRRILRQRCANSSASRPSLASPTTV